MIDTLIQAREALQQATSTIENQEVALRLQEAISSIDATLSRANGFESAEFGISNDRVASLASMGVTHPKQSVIETAVRSAAREAFAVGCLASGSQMVLSQTLANASATLDAQMEGDQLEA